MQCKSYSHFFSKKFQYICVSLDVNFNELLTNDIVSFEQLGPAIDLCRMLTGMFDYVFVTSECPDQMIWALITYFGKSVTVCIMA